VQSGLIDFVSSVAKEAGEKLMESFRKDPELILQRSSAKDAATAYDKLVDQFIVAEIRKNYPSHSILAEESGYLPADPGWLWIIDSLDGTGNFANENPFFAVCIAVLRQDVPIAGVINAPGLDEFYVAEKNSGAYLNARKIQVSSVPELQKGYLIYCEGGDKNRSRTGALLANVYPQVTDVRKLGSAGLETAWVAGGRSEAYFTTQIDPWDVAAGVLLVTEAGGCVTDFQGNPWKPQRSDLVFSNGLVHKELLALLEQ